MTLPEAITDALPPDDNLRIGVVATVRPLTINVQGTLVPAGSLSSYNPIVGDPVTLLRQDSTWLCLGRSTDPVTGAFPQMQAGWTSISVAAATSATLDVTFATPFQTAPAMSGNMNSAPGPTTGWSTRIINITTTGFTIFIFGTAATFTVDISWIAMERSQ